MNVTTDQYGTPRTKIQISYNIDARVIANVLFLRYEPEEDLPTSRKEILDLVRTVLRGSGLDFDLDQSETVEGLRRRDYDPAVVYGSTIQHVCKLFPELAPFNVAPIVKKAVLA